MSWADIANAVFEGGMIWFVGRSAWKVTFVDKRIAGIYPSYLVWVVSWGFWNLYYYPSLAQSFSFVAGIGVVTMNIWYLIALLYYRRWPGGRPWCLCTDPECSKHGGFN